MPGAVLLGGFHEPLHLSLGQIFAAESANCYILLRSKPHPEAVSFPRKLASRRFVWRSTGSTAFVQFYLSYLASAYAEIGQFDDAWRCIREATTQGSLGCRDTCPPIIAQKVGDRNKVNKCGADQRLDIAGINRPAAPGVSTAVPQKSRMRSATPFVSSWSTSSDRCRADRASRSTFVTTSVSPSRQ